MRRHFRLPASLPLLFLLAYQTWQCYAFDHSQCPPWLEEYERFHRQHRGAPDAQYLVAAQQVETKNGLGDRVRGMLYAVRVAAATGRVLLLTWTAPEVDLSFFFKPSRGIDWRLAGTPAEGIDLEAASAEVDIHVWGVSRKRQELIQERQLVTNGGFASDKRFLVLRSNEHPNATCRGCPNVANPMDNMCVFQFLFQASDEVQRQADAQLAALYGVGNAAATAAALTGGYAALHLRLGGQPGEPEEMSYRFDTSKLTTLMNSVTCGVWLAGTAGIDTRATPLLLLTDNNDLRRFAQRGRLAGVATSTFEAVHFGVAKNSTLQQRYSVFVDIALLARAKCIMLSPSGFSMTAWFLSGGRSCTLDVRHCVQSCQVDPLSPMCSG